VQLINVAMRLDISKSIPKRKIETVNAKLDNNPMARRVLKHLLVEHVYLHDVPVRDKQWISDKLGLPMKTQRLVDARSKRKRSGPTNRQAVNRLVDLPRFRRRYTAWDLSSFL
jgi:hypothetical protein